MKEVKKIIEAILIANSQIDWLIIHKISNEISNSDGLEFSFSDGTERLDEPFKTNQGYIILKPPFNLDQLRILISTFSNNFHFNQIALANLFIVVTRVSYQNEDEKSLVNIFIEKVGKDKCLSIFNILITSLNIEYYKHSHLKEINPQNTNDWLKLFQSTQYLHSFSDPLLSLLQLVRSDQSRELDFELIKNMNPLLRSVLIGWYGFDLTIKPDRLMLLYEIESELIFLSACIIDDSAPNQVPRDWLSQDLINLFIEKHWGNIGKYVFVHTFGISYRNNNGNELYKNLENVIHNNLITQIKSNQVQTIEWISTLLFPDDFIALFSWISVKNVDYGEINVDNKKAILNQFINELKRIIRELPIHLASQNSSNPFISFQLHQSKYINTLAFLLLFIIDVTSDDFKSLKKICNDFKLLFYGGFRSNSLATNFSEIMLLIALSGDKINGISENMVISLKKYLETLSETILIPYIHLSERDNEIWNPESENQILQYNAGKHLLNKFIADITKHSNAEYYTDFLNQIDSIKIANWPYERE